MLVFLTYNWQSCSCIQILAHICSIDTVFRLTKIVGVLLWNIDFWPESGMGTCNWKPWSEVSLWLLLQTFAKCPQHGIYSPRLCSGLHNGFVMLLWANIGFSSSGSLFFSIGSEDSLKVRSLQPFCVFQRSSWPWQSLVQYQTSTLKIWSLQPHSGHIF